MNFIKHLFKTILAFYTKHNLIRKFSSVFSVDVMVRSSAFILLPIYLKLMPESDFGVYNYWISVIGIFVLIAGFGMTVTQSKLYFEDVQQRGSFLFTLNVVLLVLLTVFLAGLYFFNIDKPVIAFFFNEIPNFEQFRLLIYLGIISQVYTSLLLGFFTASEQIRNIQYFNLTRFVLVNGVVITLLVYLHTNPVYIRLLVGFATEILITLLFSYFYIKQMRIRFNGKYVFKILKISIPYTFAVIPGMLILFADKYYIEKYGVATELSIYYLAVTVSGVIPVLLLSLQNIWMPEFFKEENIKENIRKTRKLIIYLTLVLLIISILLWFILWLALTFTIVDEIYRPALILLPIMFISQIFVAIATLIQNYLIHFKRTDIILYINLLFLVPSVFLLKFSIHHFSIIGAATGVFIINAVGVSVYFLVVKRYLKLKLIKS